MRVHKINKDGTPGYLCIRWSGMSDVEFDNMYRMLIDDTNWIDRKVMLEEHIIPKFLPYLVGSEFDEPEETDTGCIWLPLAEDNDGEINADIFRRELESEYYSQPEMQEVIVTKDTVTLRHYKYNGIGWHFIGENGLGISTAEFIAKCLSAQTTEVQK